MSNHGKSARIATWLAVLSVGVMLCALGARKIWTVDYWWQWKTGEYVAAHGVPSTDVFSYTEPDHPRIELRWGYCLALFKISAWFGRGSAVVLKCLALLATFALVTWIAVRRGGWLCAGFTVAIAVLASSQRFFVRPEILTYLMIALFLLLLDVASRRPTRWIYALPLLTMVWVNCHGLFVLGPALVGAWLTGELLEKALAGLGWGSPDPDRNRRIATAAGVLAACLLASMLNPYGYRALVLPLVQLTALHGTAMKAFYSELQSPFALEHSFVALTYYKLLIALTLVSTAFNWRRQRAFWWIVIVAFGYLSATAIRNLPLFSLVSIPFVVRNLSESNLWKRPPIARALPAARIALSTVLIGFCAFQTFELVTNRFNIRQRDTNQFGVGVAAHRFPVRATEFLKASGELGPIFNSSATGSYLLASDVPVFIDPRGEVYVDRIIEEYRQVIENPSTVQELIRRYDLRVFFLETTMTSLIETLHKRSDWRIVYADEVATILFRSDTAPRRPALDLQSGGALWLQGVREQLPSPAELTPSWQRFSGVPYVNLARLCVVLGAYEQARALFRDALRLDPAGFDGFDLLAYSTAQTGDHERAVEYYERAIALEPDNAGLRKLAANNYFRLGRLDRAAEELERYLAVRAEDAEGWALRGIVALQLRQYEQADKALSTAISLRPDQSAYHYYRAQAMKSLQRFDEASRSLQTALQLDPANSRAREELRALRPGGAIRP